ncbi:MAG TPA: hypothetical protein DF712_12735 [Balneola sp.]|nr:hypothetical protein [Bacteroidota bacterium]MAB66523.1 hypothetical protein [Bacteroidota bacterium]HCI72395.1 hypothetical protein [Balneola sp.]HCT53311.1 hypothetical protein [Balneola sp.]|tara:strand:- start:537 stop:1166 length:630 start_codon:yes stop_codon:yes gene_type:complete
MKLAPIFLFLLFIVSACDSKKVQPDNATEVDSLAVQLVNSATERYGEYIFGRIESTDSLEVSLNELDKAIEIEPTQIDFYSHKATILLALGREKQAIQILESALTINPDFAEIITRLGFINEKIGEMEIAQKWYQRALVAYDKRIEENRFVVNSKANKAFLLLFTENEETAKKAYSKLKQEYPDNNEIDYLEFVFEDFDKEEFLSELYK